MRLFLSALLLLGVGCTPSSTETLPADAETAAVASTPDAAPSRTESQDIVAAMQGTWRSKDDELYTMQIEGDRVIESYAGVADPASTVRAVQDCDDLEDDPSSDVFVFEGEDGIRCFVVDAITDTSLAYLFLPRGNRLHFARVE